MTDFSGVIPVRSLKICINGDKWTINVYSKQDYESVDKNARGECLSEIKTVVFNHGNLNKELILHEISHTYFDYLCLSTTSDIKLDDAEEIFCDFISKYIVKINRTVNIINRKLKDLYKQPE